MDLSAAYKLKKEAGCLLNLWSAEMREKAWGKAMAKEVKGKDTP